MKSVSSESSNSLLIKFVIKSALSTLISVGILSLIASEVLIRLDISLDIIGIISVVICAVSAFLISTVSVKGFKNNGAIMGIISALLLILYSLFNAIFNENTSVLFFIKLALILAISALGGALSVKRSRAIKV